MPGAREGAHFPWALPRTPNKFKVKANRIAFHLVLSLPCPQFWGPPPRSQVVRPQVWGQGDQGYCESYPGSRPWGKVGWGLLTCTGESGLSPRKDDLYFFCPCLLRMEAF
jgi:hypothetical protein